MKPIKLTLCGINSFSETAVIDFEKLTKSGIFGIFGDTGSGKSTILDSICFALYGKVGRSREKLDIINYKSEVAEVIFVFDVLDEGRRKTYTVERSLKKKSGIHKAMLYETDGDIQVCLADNASGVTKKITELLGVDCEDFGKCIALPQGEFSQFVKAQTADRIALIERLFNLSKYGDRLKERIKQREQEAEIAYKTLQAQADTFSDVTQEYLNGLTENLKTKDLQVLDLQKESEKAESNLNLTATLFEKRKELDGAIEELNKLLQSKSEMDELRLKLNAVPKCRQVLIAQTELDNKKELLKACETGYIKLIDSLSLEQEKLKSVYEKQLKANFDEQINAKTALSAAYASCEGKPEKIEELNLQLKHLRDEYKKKEEDLALSRKALTAAEAEAVRAENDLKNFGSFDLDHFINVQFKGALLKHEYASELDYLSDLKSRLLPFKDKSALYEFIEHELKERINIYKERILFTKNFSLTDAQTRLKIVQSAEDEQKRLLNAVNEKKNILKDCQNTVKKYETELSYIKADGEKLKVRIEEIKVDLKKAYGDRCDYKAAKEENELALKRLKAEKAETEKIKAEKTALIADISAKIAAAEAEKSSLTKLIEELTEKLKDAVQQSGLESVEECLKLSQQFSKFENAEKSLDEYDNRIISLNSRKAELEKTDGIESVSETLLENAKKTKAEAASKLNGARESVAILKKDIQIALKRLEEKAGLIKELNLAEKQLNLVSQLKELTRGNKFMEFIANEYLFDISALASNTLLKLTDGRYFLTYTDTFYVGDNFNCGNLRGVNTLSGGETFLVSLSLALALSETICAKSLKSIEFFFLDEGFGTLDSTLVDTVMDALEKLKSSSFTIGVISHVEELKHRIDSKITVIKATESHGSSVQLCC